MVSSDLPCYVYEPKFVCYDQIQKNGLFSLGGFSFGFDVVGNLGDMDELILPFYGDVDTSVSGNVSLITVRGGPLLSELNTFIRARQGVNFDGNWALIAEWREMAELHVYPCDIPGAGVSILYVYTYIIYIIG